MLSCTCAMRHQFRRSFRLHAYGTRGSVALRWEQGDLLMPAMFPRTLQPAFRAMQFELPCGERALILQKGRSRGLRVGRRTFRYIRVFFQRSVVQASCFASVFAVMSD